VGKKYLIQLYYSFIFPYLIYCNVIWGNAAATTIWPIFRLQKIALRLITNTKRGHSTKIHSINLRLLRVPEIYTYSVTIFMYKYTHQMMPINLNSLFRKNQDIHSYNTRGAQNLRTPQIKTTLAEKFITSAGAKIWNSMKNKLDTTQKISTFKQKLISLLLENYEQ
jgi:hypothetical protein